MEALRVVAAPRADISDLAAAGEKLRVGSVVLGSVQRNDDQQRVAARLVNPADGTQLWSASYDRVLDGVFDVQREISRAIVGAIEEELGIALHAIHDEARYGTSDVRAYELWRKALDLKMVESFPSEESLRRALQYNLEAVAIDPDFPMGRVGLGTTYQWLYIYTRDQRDRVSAADAFERAVALDPANVFARASFAQIYGEFQRWSDVVDQVTSVDPWTSVADVPGAGFWYVFSLLNLGRWEAADVAISELERVRSMFPDRHPSLAVELALPLAMVRATGRNPIMQSWTRSRGVF